MLSAKTPASSGLTVGLTQSPCCAVSGKSGMSLSPAGECGCQSVAQRPIKTRPLEITAVRGGERHAGPVFAVVDAVEDSLRGEAQNVIVIPDVPPMVEISRRKRCPASGLLRIGRRAREEHIELFEEANLARGRAPEIDFDVAAIWQARQE